MHECKKNYLLIIILIIALIPRIIFLNTRPNGLHSDEASFLLNSVSIMQTGKDEDGRSFPIYLESIKDHKPALFSYLQIPFIFLFGPTNAASRLPSVLLGLISIYLFYLQLYKVFNKQNFALLGALLLAISPWHIMNSRATQEVILSIVFFQLSLLIFQKLISNHKRKSIKQIIIPLTWFFITNLFAMYSYHSAKVTILGFYSLILFWKFLRKPSKKIFAFSSIIISILVFSFIITVSGAVTRFGQIGLLNNDLPLALVIQYTTDVSGITSIPIIRLFYNKPFFYFREFLSLYFKHFTGDFLFISGGDTGRYHVPAHGVFYLIELIPMLLGIYFLLKHKKYKKILPLLLILLAIAPIPAALTTEGIPSDIRAFPMIFPLIIILMIGFEYINTLKKHIKLPLFLIILMGYIWNIAYFSHQMFVHMPFYQPWHRSRDYEEAAQVINDLGPYYDNIVISNDLREIYIYLWRHNLVSINDLQKQPLARYKYSYQLNNLLINRGSCDFSQAGNKSLLIGSKECVKNSEQDLVKISDLYFDDNSPSFGVYRLVEATPSAQLQKTLNNYFEK